MQRHERRFYATASVRRDEFAAITGLDMNSGEVNRLVNWCQDFANEVRDSVLAEAAILARDLTVPTEWRGGNVLAHRHPSPVETERHIWAARETA